MLICQGPSFYLNFLSKKGHNSKIIGFRVMPLVLQLHLVMISKYSKFGDTFNTFSVMCYLKSFSLDDNDDDLAITIANFFAKNLNN